MENFNLKKFKEESIKHGFIFLFEPFELEIKSYDAVNIYSAYKLFKTDSGMDVIINSDATYIIIGQNNDYIETKIRSIPHILKVLKTVYND